MMILVLNDALHNRDDMGVAVVQCVMGSHDLLITVYLSELLSERIRVLVLDQSLVIGSESCHWIRVLALDQSLGI